MEYPRLDRTRFKIQSFQEADDQHQYWLTKTPVERLQAAYYLISVAWGFDINNPPRLDRTKFSMRKHG
ncbi:MAG TPA: hypothetical protein ENJ95_14070 [Bacteroidetes bacterium]|nr:hypothetical protein [Bacteroidota bacterium]